MKKTIASTALSLALMSSTAMAEHRPTDAVSAMVRRPIGAVAGAVHRLFGARQPRNVARREQPIPIAESQPGSTQPAPQDQTVPQAAAPTQPPAPTAASTMPPVQPLE
jgi:hypothetical protein